MTETWHNYGYGIQTNGIVGYSLEQLKELVGKAPKFQKEIEDWFSECDIEDPTIEDYLDFDQDFGGGITYILREVIAEAEDISLSYCDDHNGSWYLMLPPLYPWDYKDEDKKKLLDLTREDLEKTIKKYVSILTDKEPVVDFQSAEDWG